jgi:hypothetical protein
MKTIKLHSTAQEVATVTGFTLAVFFMAWLAVQGMKHEAQFEELCREHPKAKQCERIAKTWKD